MGGRLRGFGIQWSFVVFVALVGCEVPGAGDFGEMPVRVTPIAVEADARPAWELFDRDVTTVPAPAAGPVSVVLAGDVLLHRVRAFGADASIEVHVGGASVGTIELPASTAGWATLTLEQPTVVAQLSLTHTDDGAALVSEVELWALGAEFPVQLEVTPDATARELNAMGADLFGATPSSASLDLATGACATFEVALPRHPGAYRRAWLRYESVGAFRSWALSRAINGGPAMRGLAVPSDDEHRAFVHRIDPEQLSLGTNRVELCIPGEASGGPIQVGEVDLVLELDHGSNIVDVVGVGPAGGIATLDATGVLLGEPIPVSASEEVIVAFDRFIALDRIHIESSAAEWAGACVLPSGELVDLGLDANTPGQFRVLDAPRACAGLRLAASSATEVSGLRVFGSGAARRVDFPQIVLVSPREHFGHEAFVDGWARAPSRVGGGAVVSVDGVLAPATSGTFGERIVRGSDPTAPWPVEVRATFADGSSYARGFILDRGAGWLPGSTGPGSVIDDGLTAEERARRFGEVGQRVEVEVSASEDTHVELGTDVALDIPAGAVRGRTTVSITHLGPESLPALNAGMVNVTAPFAHGYEMLPHGQQFDEPVTVTLPYQPSLLLEGYEPSDVETYYYDTEDARWEPLARASVDEARQITASLTDHFTVMISALVVAPEHPTVASFDPNRMSGIEPASPSAGINVIAPPTANSRGDANLSYPLELPGGRRGMQPSLAITYSSSRENGWLGVGWDLPVSSIEIDTRFGVPRYSATEETETYLLDGGQLSPVTHRSAPIARRGANAIFHERVEGNFHRIIRRGSSPATYYWEVVDRSGIRSFYGGTSAGRDPSAILADDDGNGFRWALREVIDTFGNRVVYEHQIGTWAPPGRVPGRDLYLTAIHYTLDGSSGTAPYHVFLRRTSCASGAGPDCRPDVTLNGRGGFVQATAERLQRIEVLFGSTLVRAWELGYEVGSFERTRLTTIEQFGVGDVAFPGNTHRFSYYDDLGAPDAAEVTGFAGAETWDGGGGRPDGVDIPSVLGPDGAVSALGGGRSVYGGTHFYLGFNPTHAAKTGSVGGAFDNRFVTSQGLVTFVDIDGDGLPDRVRNGPGGYGYHRNLFGMGSANFEEAYVPIPGLTHLSRGSDIAFGMGVEGYYGPASFHANVTFGVQMEDAYLSDVNGDGLVDLVDAGGVRFNRLEDGRPVFEATSLGTPLPIDGGVVDTGFYPSELGGEGLRVEDLAPPIDLVRRWIAPYPGRVRISGPISRLLDAPSGADGVLCTIQREGEVLFSRELGRTEASAANPSVELDMLAGQRLYFRVHSLADGRNDGVQWAPVIDYVSLPPGIDENALSTTHFSAEQDFVLAGRPGTGVLMPFDGRARVEGTLRKLGSTTADVAVRLVLSDSLRVLPDIEVFSTVIAASTTTDLVLDRSFDVEAGRYARLLVSSDTPIDLSRLAFSSRPRPAPSAGAPPPPRTGAWLSYEDATDADGSTIRVRDDDGQPVGFDVSLPAEINVYSEQYPDTQPVPTLASGTVEVSWRTDMGAVGGDLTVAVKSEGELLLQRTVVAVPDAMRRSVSITVPPHGSRPVFLSVTAHDPRVFAGTTVAADGEPIMLYGPSPSTRLAQSYRGWSVVGYNAGGGRGSAPIDPDLLEAPPSGEDEREAREADYDLIDPDGDRESDLDGDGDGSPDLGGFGTIADGFSARVVAVPLVPAFDGRCRASMDGAPVTAADCDTIQGPHWAGPPEIRSATALDVLFARAAEASSTHMGASGLTFESGARAPTRVTVSTTVATGGGVSAGSVGVTGATSAGFAHGLSDFFDLNGDGFPDVVGAADGTSAAQFTSPLGGLSSTPTVLRVGRTPGAPSLRGDVHHTNTVSQMLSLAGSTNTSARSTFGARAQSGSSARGGGTGSSEEGTAGTTSSLTAGFDVGGTFGYADSTDDYQDINGDGLPDRVHHVDAGLEVFLNLGYRFAPAQIWPIPDLPAAARGTIHGGYSEAASFGASLGVNVGDSSYGGGVSMGRDSSFTARDDLEDDLSGSLLDINGDGLLDRVIPQGGTDPVPGLLVYINLGQRFSDHPVLWRGALTHDGDPTSPRQPTTNESVSLSGSAYVTVPAGPLCTITGLCYLIIGVAVDGGASVSRTVAAIRDVDGDGNPDHLVAEGETDLSVARSRVGRTNMLQSVTRPMGARFDIDYARSAPTAALAGSRWVLSSVRVFDGVVDTVPGAPVADHSLSRFHYEGGAYDRFERELFGFAQVTVEELDTRGWNGSGALPDLDGDGEPDVYRRARLSFSTESYATRGLLVGSELSDGAGRRFSETDNAFVLLGLDGHPTDLNRVRAGEPTFPALTVTHRRTLEGGSDSMVRSESMQYDAVGNVTRYVDAGGAGGGDDVIADIRYSASSPGCASSHIIGVPVAIDVRDLSGHLLSSRASDLDCSRGVITELRQELGSGTAVTSLSYDSLGNLSRIVTPANRAAQRYALDFTYDATVHTYVTRVTDSFGYTSSTDYDLRFGLPTREVDLSGERVLSRYDAFGRVSEVVGPFQPDSGYTLRFAYHPTAPVPMARTSQIDRGGDDIVIATYTDGLGRALQTQRDGTVHVGDEASAADLSVVSGRIAYDPWGRVVAMWHPTTTASTGAAFVAARDSVDPTVLAYDVRDRLAFTTLPDGATTTRTISLAPALDGAGLWQRTLTTDAEGSTAETYTDARDRIRAVVEHIESRTPTTRYEHDPLDRLVRITDAAGHVTTATYDLGGRRIALDQPDAGLVTYTYDPAGNMVSRVTPNLRARGGAISYAYDFTHLVSVDYPFTASDVTYTWGPPSAPEHGAGRITTVTDATGTETRGYDALGQTVRETRTIFGRGGDEPHVYTSRSLYDTWGRMQQLTYPNGEVLTYQYDAGGMVRRAGGVLGGDTFVYLERLEYDAFGQRVFEEAGNGIRSHFTYDEDTRRIARLQAGEFQDLAYSYDGVGNILALANTPLPTFDDRIGGRVSQTFGYDELHRLTHATGEWEDRRHRTENYTFDSRYSDTHDIVHRTQAHTAASRPGASHVVPVGRTSYDYGYAYSASHPHAPTTVGERTLSYDLNGNLVSMIEPRSSLRRSIVWDEEDRIASISDNGRTTEFVYDDEGQRTIKRGPRGETVYAFPTWVVRSGSIGTSHIFVGSTRVASHVWPGRAHLDPPPDDALGGMLGRWWEHRSDSGFMHARNTEMNPHYRVPSHTPMSGRPSTQFLYFYHPDHLGSTEYVTDTDGELYEHAQYFPSGETWVREDDGADRLPWLFTSQELDAETGLYYLNARYYDPRVGVFASTDPVRPGTNMGTYVVANLATYTYSWNNPIVLRDPGGAQVDPLTLALGGGAIGGVVGFVGYMMMTPSGDRSVRGALGATAGGAVTGATLALIPAAVVLEAIGGSSTAIATVVTAGGAAGVAGGTVRRDIEGTPVTPETIASDSADGVIAAMTSVLLLRLAGVRAPVREPVVPVGRAVPSINMGQQGKHILGHANYRPGRSVLTADPASLASRAGTGTPVGDLRIPLGEAGSRERVNFGRVIGEFIVEGAADGVATTNGIIHYSSRGIHIVPAAP